MKKEKKKKGVNVGVKVLLVTIGVLILVAVGSYLSGPQSVKKKPAEEYFRVSEAYIVSGEPRENGTAYMIYDIYFELQAVGGDAHNVIIQSWAMAEPVELGDISEGKSKDVRQNSPNPYGYFSEMNEDGKFPMQIRITSKEAEGKIIIPLTTVA